MALLTIWLNYYDEWDNTYYWLAGHHENVPNSIVIEVADEVIETLRTWTQNEINDILSYLYKRNGRTN